MSRCSASREVPSATNCSHLTRQFGRYIAACTWFEAIIKPVLGKSVLGNGYTLRDTEYSITPKDARLCRKCAVRAVKAMQ